MDIDVLGSIDAMLGGAPTRAVSTYLGESEESTRTGLRAGVAALLANLIHRSSNATGAAEIWNTATSKDVDSGSVSLPSALGQRGGFDATVATGQSLLGSLLGGRASAVSQAIAQRSGVRASSATALLALAAPVL